MTMDKHHTLRPRHRITDKHTYDTIVRLTRMGNGRPPSMREIAKALGTVKSNAYSHVKKLAEAGLVEKPSGNLNVLIPGSTWTPPDYPTAFNSVGLLPKKRKGGKKDARSGSVGAKAQGTAGTTRSGDAPG